MAEDEVFSGSTNVATDAAADSGSADPSSQRNTFWIFQHLSLRTVFHVEPISISRIIARFLPELDSYSFEEFCRIFHHLLRFLFTTIITFDTQDTLLICHRELTLNGIQHNSMWRKPPLYGWETKALSPNREAFDIACQTVFAN